LQQAQLQKRITVAEAVGLWASLYRRHVDPVALLERLGLADKRRARFMTLSGGQKQRLFVALALVHDPDVVMLDELTTGLDPQARLAIWEMVRGMRERGKTVLLTTHLMEEAERLCDRVAIVERGRVIDVGTPGALVRTHCPEQTVVVSADASAVAHFQAMPTVDSVAVQDGQMTIRSRRGNLVTDVIGCIAEHRIRVTDFRTELPTLEDVFLRLTGRSIRE
jgi:ABC-2 type transport system ATP-binding protein